MGDKALAIFLWIVVGALGAFAIAGGIAGRVSRGRIPGVVSGFLLGAVMVLLILALATVPQQHMMDLGSAGIELGIVMAPDDPSRVGAPRDGPDAPGGERDGVAAGNARAMGVALTKAFAWYTVALLAALVAAAALGGIAGSRTPDRFGLDPRAAIVSLAFVMALSAIVTVWLWPSLRATALALAGVDQSVGPDVGTNLTEVAQHPEAMWGRTVTISGFVDRVLGPRAVLLGSDKPIVAGTVLVLSEKRLADLVTNNETGGEGILEGDVAQVTGEVLPLAEIDPGRIPTGIAGYEGRGVVLARLIDLDIPITARAGDKEFLSGSDGPERGVTIDYVLDYTDQILGRSVSVIAEVEEGLLSPHHFLLGDRGLLAISPEPHPEVFVEATAHVTGEVRRFGIEELEREFGIDLDETELRQYEGEPVIVVHAVEVVP